VTRLARASLCAEPHEAIRVSTFRVGLRDDFDAVHREIWSRHLTRAQMAAITVAVVALVVAGVVR
jgi:hypothetical protein